MTPSFIHLRTHSEYSVVDSIIRVEALVDACKKANMPAVALTDQSNLFATIKFYQAACAAGIKPILGLDVWLQSDHEKTPSRLVLLSQNKQGYQNLLKLSSKSYQHTRQQGYPVVRKDWIFEHSEGLLVLSGNEEGEIGRALLTGQSDLAQKFSDEWQKHFPDRFYLQLQRLERSEESAYIQAVLDIAEKSGIPVVATNETCFLQAEDFEAHEARVCIGEGALLTDPKRVRRYTDQQYLRTPQEMLQLFDDMPEACANSVEIAKRCNLDILLGEYFLPKFPVPPHKTTDQLLQEQAVAGLEARLDIASSSYDDYRKRLDLELSVINAMGFPSYFLIVADFIQWAKHQGIPVGPGRGSGAGSLVAYVLGITDLDPIMHGLLFERFLNPERVSLPDFDIDFCMERRDEVIDYVTRTYGHDQVAQIITFGSMAARAVIRDVGRVLGRPYGMVDKLAKLIPFELGITLEKAFANEEPLRQWYEKDEDIRELWDLAIKLEGLVRNVGKHAGGVVIAPSALTDYTPLYCDAGDDQRIVQYDKDDIESVGLVKFDFLGLRTLTIIDWAVKTINKKRTAAGQPSWDIAKIPTDDAKTYQLLQSGDTTAVFQIESRGMKELIRRLKPNCFEDIVALVALFRPGPLQSGMVDDFIQRKHGLAALAYPHPRLEAILKTTYGVILYQEQVMQIAQVLAGYTLGSADLLRRAMGKKKPEEMEKQREIFVQGSVARGLTKEQAVTIFDLIEKFAGYGFNKSHSAAYAMLSYQTAWLKTHYPAEFMAAVLSSDCEHTDKVVAMIDECHRMKLTISPPDVNLGHYHFTVDDGAIIYGLGAVKGVGESALSCIIDEREKHGPYRDLFDLCARIDLKRINRRTMEALIKSGACDHLGPHRAILMMSLTRALQGAEKLAEDQHKGQFDLFSNAVAKRSIEPAWLDAPEWSDEERLNAEKETLGLYLTGHPMKRYVDELPYWKCTRLAECQPTGRQTTKVAGLIVQLRTMATKQGGRMAIATLDDSTARLEVMFYSDAYQQYRDILSKGQVVIIEGEISVDEFTQGLRMAGRSAMSIAHVRGQLAQHLRLTLQSDDATGQQRLAELLKAASPGVCPIIVRYQRGDVQADFKLTKIGGVLLTDEWLESCRRMFGKVAVQVVYRTA